MSLTGTTFVKRPFGAYYQSDMEVPDAFLTKVGPKTPCGEFLRRYWQPIAYAQELTDRPLRAWPVAAPLLPPRHVA